MNILHRDLQDRWNKFSIFEQMSNIGAEVGRTLSARKKNNEERSRQAFYRALELIDFTIDDPQNKNSLSEILRMRELLVDYFAGNNIYKSSNQAWEKYFYPFNLVARNN